MKTVQYRNLKFRVGAAFFAALYILFHGRPPDFVDAFTSPEFYFQLALSFSIALVLIYLVHSITKILDKHYNWRTQRPKRFAYQFSLCVVLPSLLDTLYFYFHFKSVGQSVFKNGFIWKDLPIVAGLFALLSAYYWNYYLMATEKELYLEIQAMAAQDKHDNKSGILEIKWKGTPVQFNVAKDVLYFFRMGKVVYLMSSKGNAYIVDGSISNLTERFGAFGFIRINPGVAINKVIVMGYENGEKRYTLSVIVRYDYQKLIGDSRNYLLIVTREYRNNFKKSLELF